MDALLPFVLLAGGLAAVLGSFTWLASRVRRRGLAGGAMGAALASYEEAFRTTAYASHVEIRAQAERRSPLLSPDDWRWAPAAPDGTGAEAGRTASRGSSRSRRGRARWFRRRRGPLVPTGVPGREGAGGPDGS
ncbi:hypothetical protein PV387_02785 [Streptomyces sp. ME02-6987-2C]|uniref:hypothetical protein n=1 Tax=Streptomyces sp. ME02-6987-2C TaxID=3028676 RepID=UPI0029A0A244|nr:hypothetical protein [Streptomyces sp. ME02-6987-2C]MDX3364961.1 hypothetical protein [Streptomyces sp. ME02-6987-2C]